MAPNVVINCVKDDKKVAKKDSPLLPCLIVYSLKQKRERVAHCLSVFYIEIFDFDSFDMILKFPCKKYKYFLEGLCLLAR